MPWEMFRSQLMTRCQIMLPPDAAFQCIMELGVIGLVEFIDMKPELGPGLRRFTNEVKRLTDMEATCVYLTAEMQKEDVEIDEWDDENIKNPEEHELFELETLLDKLQGDVRSTNMFVDSMNARYFDLVERKQVLACVDHLYHESSPLVDQSSYESVDENAPPLAWVPAGDEDTTAVRSGPQVQKLRSICGVILSAKLPSFDGMLYRICDGNALIRFEPIEFDLYDPMADDSSYVFLNQAMFMIFFQSDKLFNKIKRVCDSFGATIIDIPEKASDRELMAEQTDQRIQEYVDVLYHSHERKYQMLEQCGTFIEVWMGKIRKLKGIYVVLNQLDYDMAKNALVGECWIPDKYMKKCIDGMNRGVERAFVPVEVVVTELPPGEEPPTFHEVNKFTKQFQVIIDAYGVANYREVNPAPFAIVTFPFLFSLMFGDAGHALLMVAAALAFIKYEDKLNRVRNLNEITRMFFNGRYIVLLMGLFSMYSGFMYNDFVSKPINIAGSSWYPDPKKYNLKLLISTPIVQLNPNPGLDYTGYPYPFGMDPVWSLAGNKIPWLNTYKMKMAIIFGVSQMMYGNMMALMNHLYFGDYVSIFCEFIPMVLYLAALFGYLALIIVAKFVWFGAESCHCAPALLIALINMFLMSHGECSTAFFYRGQQMVETILVLIIVISIFWILIPKPLVLLLQHKRKLKRLALRGEEPVVYDKKKHVRYGEHPFKFSEAFIHQCIHMIEYCLGCVSHTASYLRLWALSLAHAQLSEVIWMYLMNFPMTFTSGRLTAVLIFLGWGAWGALTVAIMLLMEGLSAFLHTLRLHWVEFQSKFYRGDGHAFKPFSFAKIMHPET